MKNKMPSIPLLVATHRCVDCNGIAVTTMPTNPEQLDEIVELLNKNAAGCRFSSGRFLYEMGEPYRRLCREIGRQAKASAREDGINF